MTFNLHMKETVGLNVFDLKISTVRILHFLVVLSALKFVFNIEVHDCFIMNY